MMRKVLFVLCVLCFLTGCQQEKEQNPVPVSQTSIKPVQHTDPSDHEKDGKASGTLVMDYLGENPPDLIPVKFASGIVSKDEDELNGVFTPDGSAFFYTVRNGWEAFRIYQMKKENSIWSDAVPAPFSSNALDADPFISSDGQKLYFCSNRKINSDDTMEDWNIWVSSMEDGQWQSPVMLPFNTSECNEMYVSVAENGDVYFHADYQASSGMDVYCSRYQDGTYTAPENLGLAVNSSSQEYDPMIAPDGSYLIFTSTRNCGKDDGDLYIAFSDDKGQWQDAINMGTAVNSPYFDYCPSLSPDGKYLFFSSYREANRSLGDIYWVSSNVIENIKTAAKVMKKED